MESIFETAKRQIERGAGVKIELLDGYHLTQTERAAIKTIIEAGQTYGRNRPNTKTYDFIEGWKEGGVWHYKVKIGTFATYTIGAAPRWDYSIVTIKTNKP